MNKTIIAAVIIAALTGLQLAGVINAEQYQAALAFAASFGLVALRMAVKKNGNGR